MKKSIKSFTLLVAFLLVVSFLPVCVCNAAEMPGELKAVADKAAGLAASYAKNLDGEWGDKHVNMIDSKKGYDFPAYEGMRAVLCGLMEDSDATYIYVLYPSGAIDSEPFFISADGSDNPDEYGTENEWENGFAAAWKGAPTAGDNAWTDYDGETLLISAYAPIHDSKGDVIAIIGVDYPAPEAAKYPDWVK